MLSTFAMLIVKHYCHRLLFETLQNLMLSLGLTQSHIKLSYPVFSGLLNAGSKLFKIIT